MALAFIAVLLVSSWSLTAGAYPWMIREGYTACATCHADPSGGGLLTAYGRAQSDTLLSASWSRHAEDDASKASRALFGLVPEPDFLLYSVAYRGAAFASAQEGRKASARYILMQLDGRAQLTIADRVRVNGSLGFVPSGGQLAALFADRPFQLISREHWIGVDIGEDKSTLLRAGRIAVPYGLRGNEHTMWSRSTLRTDIAFHQQHGIAIARTTDTYRTEWMAILGNYQLAPDLYRERGYAGFFERSFGSKWTMGLSSQLTHAEGDLFRSRRQPITRHTHGLFARYVPVRPLVVMVQADAVIAHRAAQKDTVGTVSLVQFDLEIARGVHVLPALEWMQASFERGGVGAGGWFSVALFPYAHVEVRADGLVRSIDTGQGRVISTAGLLQLHVYL